jgi:predicted small metal-binding protein
VKTSSRSTQSSPDVDAANAEAYLFQCGHEQCGSELTAASRDALLLLMAQHLKEVHSIDKITNTLLSYLEATCVTALPSGGR